MLALIKSFSADDVDIKSFQPEDPGYFALDIRLRIGPEESASADDFDVRVCTPRWLGDTVHGARWGRHLLIVDKYDLGTIEEFISFYVSSCYGEDWDSIAEKLSRVFRWEFEDYRG
jgi:hypothetical protein